MKYIFISLFLLSPLVVSGEVYKCTQSGGKVGFSDMPCLKSDSEERITMDTKKTDWVSRLRLEKPSSIKIINVIRNDSGVTIKYEFNRKQDSNSFVRLVKNLSEMPVILVKYVESKGGALGRGQIKASKAPTPLFGKLKRGKK